MRRGFGTLQKAAQRLLGQPYARRVLRGTVRRFFGRRKRSRRVALDSSGFDCGQGKKRGRSWTQLAASPSILLYLCGGVSLKNMWHALSTDAKGVQTDGDK